MDQLKRTIIMGVGFLFVILGIIGAFLPVMPSIPFLVIASFCFSKSSTKFHDMLMNNPLVGPHIRSYNENNGISLITKAFLIVSQWAGILISSLLFVHGFFGRILMVVIGVAVTGYILSLKTAKK